ncbi:MAG: hypothetical protein CMJ32_12535 [Phycisphaerae bacterium]|nr:hypothetical protein [Phycisphaerae bacterium]
MKTVHVKIQGTTALLQHRFGAEAQAASTKKTRAVQIKEDNPREEAEKVCYRDRDGHLYHPSASIARLLREAGGAHKQRGSWKSLKYIVPAGVRLADDVIELYELDGVTRKTDFEVDSRPVTIPATKGRIMRHRPIHYDWVAKFSLVINSDVLDEDVIQQLLTEGGERIGIGDFRPEKGGPFGVFLIKEWAALSDDEPIAAE